MTPQLYNTLTRRKEAFEPIDPDHVRMYVCGPTVYQRIHVGNARPLVVFDVLYRLLRHLYPRVSYVRNITDVDDKIIAQAKQDGVSIASLTETTTEAFLEDARALGCLEPTHQPRATRHIGAMIRLIGRLIERGHAYAAEGHVLFDVPSAPAYGHLSRRAREEQIAGARIDVAPYKRDPADFVLWKPSTSDLPGWDSPWGRGRPGWHIECSAMAEELLGVPFDIHGGGLDLVFPHHENEIAQTCCAHGLDHMARYWMHNGFVDMSGEKMSKSLGNVLRMDEALAMVPGEAVRLWALSSHYRQPLSCTVSALQSARTTLDRLYAASRDASTSPNIAPAPELIEAISNDLNTPAAIAVLHQLMRESSRSRSNLAASRLVTSAQFLGLLHHNPDAWLRRENTALDVDVQWLERRIAERGEARMAGDFALADRIRADLAANGVYLDDGPSATTWRAAHHAMPKSSAVS